MTRLFMRAVLGAVALIAVSACGQKGALYLPDKGGEVVTRPGTTAAPATPSNEQGPQPSTVTPDTATKPNATKKPQTPPQ
ncbi:MAG: lipoprotein [Gammaproteobacteria bacterium]